MRVFFVQFTVITVTYLEWNRSLPHSWFLRSWWTASLLVNVWKFYTITSRRDLMAPDSYNHAVVASGIVVTCHSLLTLLALAGIIPALRKYFEADPKLSHRKKEVATGESAEESDAKLFLRNIMTRASAPFIIIGLLLTLLRGFLMQLIMKYIGNVVSATSASTDVWPIIAAILQLVGIVFGYAIAFGVACTLSTIFPFPGRIRSVS